MTQTLYERWEQKAREQGPPESFRRHERKCSICNHPDREAIEQHFLIWRPARYIAEIYDIPDHGAVYRHAHATGLFEQRRRNVRLALEPILERGIHTKVTAESVVRAVRTYAQINDEGKWIGRDTANPARIACLPRGMVDPQRQGAPLVPAQEDRQQRDEACPPPHAEPSEPAPEDRSELARLEPVESDPPQYNADADLTALSPGAEALVIVHGLIKQQFGL